MTIRARRLRSLLASGSAALVLMASACTADKDPPTPGSPASRDPSNTRPAQLQLHIGEVPFHLQAPVEREVAVTDGRTIYLAGGLDATGRSVDGVFSLDPLTGALTLLGSLPMRVHDAAAAMISGRLFVFGGGSSQSTDTIQSFDLGTNRGRVAGHLPVALSDVSAGTVGGITYLVGGWDGTTTNATIYATSDGTRFRAVGHLPAGVRYAAVAVAGTDLVVAGGEDRNGRPVRTVSVFDTQGGTVTRIVTLPSPIAHAAAFSLGGAVYVVGGRGASGNALVDVWAIDPSSGTLTKKAPLARPVADAGVVSMPAQVWLIGGWRGAAVSQVLLASLDRASPSSPLVGSVRVPPSLRGLPRDPSAVRPFAGRLLIADRGNDRLLVVNAKGHVIWRYPAPSLSAPSVPFYFPDDAFWVHRGRAILVNEEENHVLAEIAYPSGKTLWTYGQARSPGSGAGHLHQPDDVYPYPGGGVVVADALNCRILFFDPRGLPTRQIGATGNCTSGLPDTVGYPNGDTPLPNGHLLVSELHGGAIDEVTATGHPVWTVHISSLPVPSDPQPLPDGKTYIAVNYTYPGAVVRFRRDGKVLWTYRPTSGPGVLDHPSLAAWLPNGLVAVTDDFNDRVVLINPRSNRIVWQYGRLDVPGTADGYLHIPDGFDLLLPGGQTPLHVDFASPRPRAGRP